MRYRAEIDGLRAVAVIPVILFHAEVHLFKGGFVGVDIFFVISGFLITSIILKDLEDNSFSIIDFYERRARRILPALFFVMLVSLPFAWLWLMPTYLRDFAKSIVAVPLFASNILFLRESGYWDASDQLKPLLHTWSLAVEEQFYLIFPLLLLLLFRHRLRSQLLSIILLWIASFAMALWSVSTHPVANFYLLPMRAWELLTGTLAAYSMIYFGESIDILRSRRSAGKALSTLGLVLIGVSIISFDKQTPFPSAYTLAPVIGSTLILIFAMPNTLVGRMLSHKFLVKIGLMSYSIYLWHQPLLAFTRHFHLQEVHESVQILISMLSIPLAYLSWKLVESPFRDRSRYGRRSILICSLGGSLVFIAIGLLGTKTDVLFRSNESHLDRKEIQSKLEKNSGLSAACNAQIPSSKQCITKNQAEIVVWGDSHAMALVEGILASDPDASLAQITMGVCGPFFDIAPIWLPKYPKSWAERCLEFNGQVRAWLNENHSVRFAILASPFSQYISDDSKLLTRSGQVTEDNLDLVYQSFQDTLTELRSLGIEPVIFAPAPATGANIGRCLAKAEWRGISLSECDFAQDKNLQERVLVESFLTRFETDYNVIFLSRLMCEDGNCPTHVDGLFLYRDSNHLSREGSRHLGIKHDFDRLIRR